jgi:HSP20 family protein
VTAPGSRSLAAACPSKPTKRTPVLPMPAELKSCFEKGDLKMNVRDLIPWGRNNNNSTVPSTYRSSEPNPFLTLHREMNRLFDDMFRSFDSQFPSFASLTPWTSNWPGIEITENDRELKVVAEIPGVDEKDVELLLEDGILTLRGEKHSEAEDKDRQFSERFYGRFERRLPIGTEIQEDKVTAGFRNGVLTVILPKSAKAQSKAKRITINGQAKVH